MHRVDSLYFLSLSLLFFYILDLLGELLIEGYLLETPDLEPSAVLNQQNNRNRAARIQTDGPYMHAGAPCFNVSSVEAGRCAALCSCCSLHLQVLLYVECFPMRIYNMAVKL